MAKGKRESESKREGYVLIFRPWYKNKDGKIIHAKQFGKKVFPMWIKENDVKK